jgi:L-fucose mutarotase
MLKGISSLISPELLKDLDMMGHGDMICLGDCNFPSETCGKRTVRADGIKATDLLDAIMKVLPLDIDEKEPQVTLMRSTDHPDLVPPVWNEFKKIVHKYEPKAEFTTEERNGFYAKAQNSFVCVQTSEEQYFGCIILRKGTWFTKLERGDK